MQEWVNKLTVLEKNKISGYFFYSPLGLHIVKWVERKPFASYHDKKGGNTSIYGAWRSLLFFGQKRCFSPLPVRGLWRGNIPIGRYVCKRYMMVYWFLISRGSIRRQEYACSEADLEHYFKQHKSDYAWDLPRYKGAVIHCRNKKMASVIKKYLKKKADGGVEIRFGKVDDAHGGCKASIEVGVFIIGKNQYVDKLVF